MMELLSDSEINILVKKCGYNKVLNWTIEDLSNKVVGYLGDHLNLTIQVELNEVKSDLRLFVKCMPRFNKWKAELIHELGFFWKEYKMLSGLFEKFQDLSGERQWRPNLVYIREDLFVFEDVSHCGYTMPSHLYTMTFDEIIGTVKTLARFHAQSLIFEERRSKIIGKSYRIWDEYSDFLQEPNKENEDWRAAGMVAVIDFLKQYSRYRCELGFHSKIDTIIPMLFDDALNLMKPNFSIRNVVVHRDLWSNNIFLKELEKGKYHALIIDFQTVLYCSPMLDLCLLLYINTTKVFREKYTKHLIDIYYEALNEELSFVDLDITKTYDKTSLIDLYENMTMFGLTQAALIVPIIALTSEKRKELFSDPETSQRVTTVSRSKEFIDFATKDERYQIRVLELVDEIVERYIYDLNETN